VRVRLVHGTTKLKLSWDKYDLNEMNSATKYRDLFRVAVHD